jgi:hypothetical protein
LGERTDRPEIGTGGNHHLAAHRAQPAHGALEVRHRDRRFAACRDVVRTDHDHREIEVYVAELVDLLRQFRRLRADHADVRDVHRPAGGLGDADGQLRAWGVAVAVDAVTGRCRVAEDREPDRWTAPAHAGGRPNRVVVFRRRLLGDRDALPGEFRLAPDQPGERGGRRGHESAQPTACEQGDAMATAQCHENRD